MPLGGRYS